MKYKRDGFTLIELLIAATIIGILAIFATIAYRDGAGEVRVSGAQSKLRVLAGAVQRYNLDPAACPLINSDEDKTVAKLIECGYLEKGFTLADDYFLFQICASSGNICPRKAYLACMKGENQKLPSRYLGEYRYCVDEEGKIYEAVDVVGAGIGS